MKNNMMHDFKQLLEIIGYFFIMILGLLNLVTGIIGIILGVIGPFIGIMLICNGFLILIVLSIVHNYLREPSQYT